MNLPDDFGLGVVRTLAHVADPTPAPSHSVFWTAWNQAVFEATAPVLGERRGMRGDNTDPSATHDFTSYRSVSIGSRLWMPPDGIIPRAGLVSLHGAGRVPMLSAEDERWETLRSRGVAVLAVRVRGFPGSMLDLPQLMSWPLGWITYGLDAPTPRPTDSVNAGLSWILPQAVADAANACRSLSKYLGGRTPIFLHGESLGGALAVLAAARLDDHLPVARLAIGFPSLGDWPWRLQRPSTGLGLEIREYLRLNAFREDRLVELLRLLDTAVHASRLRMPTLCKLAERDDTVPAPAAAAVFNAIASGPGTKWRMTTPFGHFEGGLRNARRHALFDQAVDDFLDPARDPVHAMKPWEPLLNGGERPPDHSFA